MAWSMQEEDALSVTQLLDIAEDVEEVKTIYSTFIARYGFKSWAIMQFSNPVERPLKERISVMSWPSDYIQMRRERPDELHDPVIREAYRTNKPFTWQQAYMRADKKGKDMMDMAKEFGLDDGLVFPIKSIDTLPGGASISGDTSGLSQRHIRLLNLVSIHAYDKLEDLLGPHPFRVNVSLSPREIEVLSHASAGLTSHDIGNRLCLSARTVEHYCHSARTRLKARNLTHAVSRAIGKGLILP